MFNAKVYGYEGEVYLDRHFATMDALLDFGADLMGTNEYSKEMDVYQDGVKVGHVDFDEQRDRAMLDGYILPIHEKMLVKAGEGEFVKEIHNGRRHW